eukprot:128928_1
MALSVGKLVGESIIKYLSKTDYNYKMKSSSSTTIKTKVSNWIAPYYMKPREIIIITKGKNKDLITRLKRRFNKVNLLASKIGEIIDLLYQGDFDDIVSEEVDTNGGPNYPHNCDDDNPYWSNYVLTITMP